MTTTITTPRNNKRKQATEPVQSALERAIMADIDKSKETEIEKNDPDELFFSFFFLSIWLDDPHLTNEHRTQDCIAN